MNCTNFELAAQHLLDDRGSLLPPELRQHAERCPACRTFWRRQLTLLAATRSWTQVTAPADLTPFVLTALSQPDIADPRPTQPLSRSQASGRASRGSAWAALGSAAALMLLTALILRLSPPSEPTGPEATLAMTSPEGQSESALVSQTLAGLWQGVHTEYQELSQETTRVLDGLGELPESAVLLPSLPAAKSSSTDKPSPSWLRLARPVSDRVGQAFDFLRDAVPDETPQSS